MQISLQTVFFKYYNFHNVYTYVLLKHKKYMKKLENKFTF
ncbi:hypothetical protein HMPREF9970_0717 [Lachnoanaerobaculum saburreum F0468]|uniref:Uncharacterized protein n=1 Tax=Lachnoanaerobaculum saburreum F0468 TaxID=1095750 RepID=I0RA26_9FIRM|nr:hypothetical protein HMPREF9970_0717 [Lachnoanaerobaculum saburreum F0468]